MDTVAQFAFIVVVGFFFFNNVGNCIDFKALTKTRTDTCTHSRRNTKRKARKGRKNAHAWRNLKSHDLS